MTDLPLEGYLVVAIEQAVAAPFCTSRLADAGARVIKVERPEGDFARDYDRTAGGAASYFVWLNRGKESVALDLKLNGDLAILKEIAAKADILIQNLAPGALARLGLDSATLEELNPALIQCNISGYGEEGGFAKRKAYDLLIQAEAGLASVTGTAEAPARVGVSVCDIATGMYAHAAILEAVLMRQKSGKGAIIDVSMFDAIADWMAVPLLQTVGTGCEPARLGLHHPSIAPYGAYRCADGTEVLFAIQNEREWQRFCDIVLGKPETASDPRFSAPHARTQNRPALDTVILEIFAGHDRETIIGRLEAGAIAYAKVNSVGALAKHPQLKTFSVKNEHGKSIDVPQPPARFRGADRAFRNVPALDADGENIRTEFGPAKEGKPQ